MVWGYVAGGISLPAEVSLLYKIGFREREIELSTLCITYGDLT